MDKGPWSHDDVKWHIEQTTKLYGGTARQALQAVHDDVLPQDWKDYKHGKRQFKPFKN